MTDEMKQEFDRLWRELSKEDLWKGLSDWWEAGRRARVVVFLAIHHGEELPLAEIAQQTGEPVPSLVGLLRELDKRGVVARRGGEPPRYTIADERTFLKFVQECCQRTSVAAGHLSTLAKWAGGQ